MQLAEAQANVTAKRAEQAALLQGLEAAQRAERDAEARALAQQSAQNQAAQRLQVASKPYIESGQLIKNTYIVLTAELGLFLMSGLS